MSKLKKDIQKFLNFRVFLIVTIFLVVSFIWFRYIAGFVLLAIFAPLTFFTVRYSKMVPHISIESFTSTSILMAYLFGPWIGFIYAVSVGGLSYIMNSFVGATYLSNPVLAGIGAILAGFLKGMGFQFGHAFFIAIIVRTIIAWFWFGVLGADPIERVTHQTSQFFSNLIIYLPLLSMIYELVAPIV